MTAISNITPSQDIKSYYKRKTVIPFHTKVTDLFKAIIMQNETPTWTSALLKSAVGIAGICSCDIYRGEFIDLFSELIASNLAFSGINEIASLAYSSILKIANANNNKIETSIVRLKKISKIIFHIGMSLNCLYNYSALGFVDYLTVSYNQTEFNLNLTMQAFQISMCVASCFINLKELKNINKESFLLNNPISELINGIVLFSFFSKTNKFNHNFQKLDICAKLNEKKAIINCLNELYISESVTLDEINYYADYSTDRTAELKYHYKKLKDIYYSNFFESFTNLLPFYSRRLLRNFFIINTAKNSCNLLIKNIASINDNKNIKNDIISLLESSKEDRSKSNQKSHTKNRSYREITCAQPLTPYLEGATSIQTQNYDPDDNPKKIKKKIKTIGKAHKNQSILNAKGFPKKTTGGSNSLNASDPIEAKRKEVKAKREKALAKITELRKLHPVKACQIEKLIDKAKTFVNGTIHGKTGSCWEFEWTINGNKYRLSYETPHGSDNTNYSGNKLNRIFNVLQTVYLSGLNPKEINDYIEKYNFHSMYRYNFVYYILFNKN